MAILNASEIQPNSDKRNEFLIVLDYLLHFTSDENHATSQKKIIDYAKNEYGIDIRRDRIPQILLPLYQLTEKYPDVYITWISIRNYVGDLCIIADYYQATSCVSSWKLLCWIS